MELNFTVDNRIRIEKNKLKKNLQREIRDLFIHKNPEYFKKRNMGFYTKGIPETISTYTSKGKEFTIPRGGVRKLKQILNDKGINFSITDNRITNDLPYEVKFKLKLESGEYLIPDKYQLKQVRNAVAKQQGVLVTPTAGGKTVILSLIIEKIQQKTLIIVHTSKLMAQWVDFLSEAFNLPKDEIGIIGQGKMKIKPITVGLVQTVYKKYNEFKYDFGCIMMDECHHAPAPSFLNSIDPFPAKYRFGCTGTDYRKDGKQFLMWDVFGGIVFRITDENLKEVNRIHQVKLKVIKTNFEFWEYTIDKETNEKVKVHPHPADYMKKLVTNPERNALIYKYLKSELDNKRFCILLTDRLIHAHNWKIWLERKGIESKLFIGGDEYKEEGEIAKKEINEGKLHCLIGINQGAAEGINIPRLDRGFIVTRSAGNKAKFIQQMGRLKRKHPEKKDAIVYYFWDHLMYPNDDKLLIKYWGKENVEFID